MDEDSWAPLMFVETRVRYMHPHISSLPTMIYEYVYDDRRSGANVDRAAKDSWLMANAIAWVEARAVTKTPWQVQ